MWSGGWDGPWSFTAAILDELNCPLKPDLWSRGQDSSLGLLCRCYSRVGPSSALVVKQRLGGPSRVLKVLLKADWPTSTSSRGTRVGSPHLVAVVVLVSQSFGQREQTFVAFVFIFLSVPDGCFRLQASTVLSPVCMGS